MAEQSGISWTDATWNPVTGCSKVSPGCAHCYAETLALTRLVGKVGYTGKLWTPENAMENVMVRPERLTLPLRWKGNKRIFVNSMSDLFHELVPFRFVDQVFAVMALAPQHTFQVLTKRPERMREYVNYRDGGTFDPPTDRADQVWDAIVDIAVARGLLSHPPAAVGIPKGHVNASSWEAWDRDRFDLSQRTVARWPLPNVWLGTSVENQHFADLRIPHLLATDAAVRFLSCEPLLGPVNLTHTVGRWLMKKATGLDVPPGDNVRSFTGPWPLQWVIVGGESGPVHRPMDPEWARSIRDECVRAGVAFHLKQMGGTRSGGVAELDGREWREFPAA